MQRVRPSLGTAIVMGLKRGSLPDPPKTAYLMLGDRCVNNCAFCTQARDFKERGDLLSRITWPSYPMDVVLEALSDIAPGTFHRICLQCLMDPKLIGGELVGFLEGLNRRSNLPVSVSIPPVGGDLLLRLRELGVDRIGIALDGASCEVFDEIKGIMAGNPYTWEDHWSAMDGALDIFGRGKVTTHLMIGLGERDRDVVEVMSRCKEKGIIVSLFSFTPVKGSRIRSGPPPLGRYRALQVVRELTFEKGVDPRAFKFNEQGKMIELSVDCDEGDSWLEKAFETRGCPGCNRPYFNERPGGLMYNYPRPLVAKETLVAVKEAFVYIRG